MPRPERHIRGHARAIAAHVDIDALRGLLPARLARPSAAGDDGAWLLLLVAGRLAATAIGAALVAWAGFRELDSLLLLYGPLSTLALVLLPGLRRAPSTWAADFSLTLFFVVLSEDWRSPFYLLWLSSLALPATALPIRRALWLAIGSAVAYCAVAVIGGPVPGRLQLVSTETLAIHVSLPFMLVVALAYAAEALRRLTAERSARERLAIEAERKRIAFELHDSAKQRLHAAHLLVTSLQGRVPERAGADRRPRRDRAGVRRLGHGHEPRRAALAAGGPPPRRGDPRPRGRARARRRPAHRRSTATRPTSRRSSARTRTGSPSEALTQRAAPRRRNRDRHHASRAAPTRCASRSATTGAACPSRPVPAPPG